MSPLDLTCSKTVQLNVMGTSYEIGSTTFEKLQPFFQPSCVFSKQNASTQSIEYFIERDPLSFNAILLFYVSGELHMPSAVCPSVFKNELTFWGINWKDMNHCCLRNYVSFHDGMLLYLLLLYHPISYNF